jgi:hypothetical protein
MDRFVIQDALKRHLKFNNFFAKLLQGIGGNNYGRKIKKRSHYRND